MMFVLKDIIMILTIDVTNVLNVLIIRSVKIVYKFPVDQINIIQLYSPHVLNAQLLIKIVKLVLKGFVEAVYLAPLLH